MIELGVYRHYKGNLYEVTGVAKHSETERWHVVYQPLYGDPATRHLWIRPLEMFTEMVTVDQKTFQRFEKVSAD